jgi:phage terminase large subunit-like protein
LFPEGDEEIVGEPMHYLDWQLGPTREMFGWKVVDLETGSSLTDTRRYQSGDIWVPKKNSKTTWMMMLSARGDEAR